MSKYHDDSAEASDAGAVRLSRTRLKRLIPSRGGCAGWLVPRSARRVRAEEILDEHLRIGDSRAAIVIELNPLLVAAYTDELDCVAILRFPGFLVEEHGLAQASRLLTVNTYFRGREVARDLDPGPKRIERWVNFVPVIADFLSDDVERIRTRKKEISEEEWDRCRSMGSSYVERHPGCFRDGLPGLG